MNNIVRNENDPTVDGIDVAPTAPHSLSFSQFSLLEVFLPCSVNGFLYTKQTRYKPVTTRQNPILEPKENAIQMTSNLINRIRIPRKQQISVYRSFYYV